MTDSSCTPTVACLTSTLYPSTLPLTLLVINHQPSPAILPWPRRCYHIGWCDRKPLPPITPAAYGVLGHRQLLHGYNVTIDVPSVNGQFARITEVSALPFVDGYDSSCCGCPGPRQQRCVLYTTELKLTYG